jgi:hypothetical protein
MSSDQNTESQREDDDGLPRYPEGKPADGVTP